MAFKMLINQSTVQEQVAHKIHGFLQTYKGKHHLYAVSTGSGKTVIAASMVADLLKNGHKVYVLTKGTKEEVLFKVLAGLTEYNYKDIKNPNFRNKVDVQAKINQISEEYDSMLEIDTYLHGVNSKKLTNQIQEKLQKFKAEYVVVEDINALGDEDEYAKQMNLAVNSLNNLATNNEVAVLSFTGTPIEPGTDLPGYLQNSKLLVTRISQSPGILESLVRVRQGKAYTMARIMDNLNIWLSDKEKDKVLIVFDEAHKAGDFVHNWQHTGRFERAVVDRIIANPPYGKTEEYNGEFFTPADAVKIFQEQFDLYKTKFEEKTKSSSPNFQEIKEILSEMGKLAQKLSKLNNN